MLPCRYVRVNVDADGDADTIQAVQCSVHIRGVPVLGSLLSLVVHMYLLVSYLAVLQRRIIIHKLWKCPS